MATIPAEVKNQFMANVIPGETVLYETYGYDSTYVNFYLVVDKTPRTIKVVKIGQKVTDTMNSLNYDVVADPSNRSKKVSSMRLSPRSFYKDYRDIHFTNKQANIEDARIYNGKPVHVYEY